MNIDNGVTCICNYLYTYTHVYVIRYMNYLILWLIVKDGGAFILETFLIWGAPDI